MDTMPGMLWTKERVEKWLREHGASGDMSIAVVLASDIVYDYEAQLANQYKRIGRFVELVNQLEAQLAQRCIDAQMWHDRAMSGWKEGDDE